MKKTIGTIIFVVIVGGCLVFQWIVNGFWAVIGTVVGCAIGVGIGLLICKLMEG